MNLLKTKLIFIILLVVRYLGYSSDEPFFDQLLAATYHDQLVYHAFDLIIVVHSIINLPYSFQINKQNLTGHLQ
jgi:hypothetical protein